MVEGEPKELVEAMEKTVATYSSLSTHAQSKKSIACRLNQ